MYSAFLKGINFKASPLCDLCKLLPRTTGRNRQKKLARHYVEFIFLIWSR